MHRSSRLQKKSRIATFQVGIREVKFGLAQTHAVMFLVPEIEHVQTSFCLSKYPTCSFIYLPIRLHHPLIESIYLS